MYVIKQEKKEDWWDVESLLDLSFAPGREALSSYRLRDGVLPVAKLCLVARDFDGIIGGSMLGLGRALGETIAVYLLLNINFRYTFRILESEGGNVASLIATKFGEATPDELKALVAAGFVLFVLTLTVNMVASAIVTRSSKGAQA